MVWAVAVIAVVVLVLVARNRIHFSWQTFWQQFQQADWKKFAIAIAMIYLGYVCRSARWALFLKPVKRVGPLETLGSQVIGFTGVALFGRLADLVRPYLIARRVQPRWAHRWRCAHGGAHVRYGSMALIFAQIAAAAPDPIPRPTMSRWSESRAEPAGERGLAVFAALVRLQAEWWRAQ